MHVMNVVITSLCQIDRSGLQAKSLLLSLLPLLQFSKTENSKSFPYVQMRTLIRYRPIILASNGSADFQNFANAENMKQI
jgi:hypothetical protein